MVLPGRSAGNGVVTEGSGFVSRDTDMLSQEILDFLATRQFAAIATVDAGGQPRVTPARFTVADDRIRLAPSAVGSGRRMRAAEVSAFLRDYRYPNEHESAAFVAAATVRRDGAPLVVPLGYWYENETFYLSINNARSIRHRLRREPRIALSVFSAEEPLRAVVATGVAERVDDPEGRWSRRVFHRQMQSYDWLDVESYLDRWLAAGRTVYRVVAPNLTGWTDDAGPGAPLVAREPSPQVSFAAFSDAAPTVVVLYTGRASRRGASGTYEFVPAARAAWDSRKQPARRWSKGEGSHVEGSAWTVTGGEGGGIQH